jgi:hypothetical protein
MPYKVGDIIAVPNRMTHHSYRILKVIITTPTEAICVKHRGTSYAIPHNLPNVLQLTQNPPTKSELINHEIIVQTNGYWKHGRIHDVYFDLKLMDARFKNNKISCIALKNVYYVL